MAAGRASSSHRRSAPPVDLTSSLSTYDIQQGCCGGKHDEKKSACAGQMQPLAEVVHVSSCRVHSFFIFDPRLAGSMDAEPKAAEG